MRAWRWILGVVIVLGAVSATRGTGAKTGAAPGARRGFRGGGEPPGAGGAGSAEAKDTPIYLQGLGTVTAFYTVTVKSQVDGGSTGCSSRRARR